MKFTEHLSAHITPEWRKQYIQYEAFKDMLYSAQDQAPSIEVTDEDTVKRYYAKFEEKFFQACEKELAKINTFYSEGDEEYGEGAAGFSESMMADYCWMLYRDNPNMVYTRKSNSKRF